MHEEHDNHERWLVSYADFITLLFAFFVVMYALSAENNGKYKILADSFVRAFNLPNPETSNKIRMEQTAGAMPPALIPLPMNPVARARLEQEVRQRQNEEYRMKQMAMELRNSMSSLIEDGQVKVSESKRGLAIEINAALLFPVGSATLQGKAVNTLVDIAHKVAGHDNLIQIGGHTDNVPIASMQFPSNWELSASRAGTVVRLFEASGVEPARLVAIGYADNRPKSGNDSAEGRASNRRVTIEILADTKQEVATLPADAVH
ncbi:flagellar motor protein MotD [Burkholderiaceae bacterium DAT-1]|nr:flagellar motor protein MotD [Burkholderiaceae bacterium DAT-1]